MKNCLFSLILIILICSCNKELIDIPDTGRKIVVNGLITTDSLLNVRITESAYISGVYPSEFEDLKGADVRFYTNNTVTDSLYHIQFYSFDLWKVFNTGNYRSGSVFPETGKQYKVIVRADNLPEASASAIIPEMVEIVKVDTSGIILPPGEYESNEGVLCKIEFKDPAATANYYLFDVRETVHEQYHTTNNNLDFSCNDPIVEEKLFTGIKNEGIAFSDKLINGHKHTLTVIINRGIIGMYTSGDTQNVCFRLYSITEEYFRYIRNLNLYSRNFGNPLAEPVMLYSNVKGGYGMFSGAAVSSYPVVFRLKPF